MSDTSSLESQNSLIPHSRVREVSGRLFSSDNCITQERRGGNKQLKVHDSGKLKRKAASSELNRFAHKISTVPSFQSLQSGNSIETINISGHQKLQNSESELPFTHSFNGVYNKNFHYKKPCDWKHSEPINRVPCAISRSSDSYSLLHAYRPFPYHLEPSISNLADLSTVSLSRFPQPPSAGYNKITSSAPSPNPTDDQLLLSFTSPVMIQFTDGTFDVLNPHKSLFNTTIGCPEEEKYGNGSEPPPGISQNLQRKEEALEQAGEVDTNSREGSMRHRPLYDDLNSAYQSITSRKTDAYVLQTDTTLQPKPQRQSSHNFMHSALMTDKKSLTDNNTQITTKSKRESNHRFLQRVVRAFSMHRSMSDDSIARKSNAKNRDESRGYLSDLFSSNILNVKQPAQNVPRDISSNDIDIELGRRRPIPASFNSLFDWTDDESDYSSSVYYRNSFPHMGASSHGTNLRSMGDNDYSIQFGSNPYMHQTNTDEFMEDSLSFSDGIEPRIESTIGSILNRYNHARESCQAIPSTISYGRSSFSSDGNSDDRHAAQDGNPHADSIISHSRPISKMLPPPLLQRANPAYSGHPPQFSPPTPNSRIYYNDISTRPECSIPSDFYSTSSSYGNTRDLLLISQSAISACHTKESNLALTGLSSRGPNITPRGLEIGIVSTNEVITSKVLDHDIDDSNCNSNRISGIPSQYLGPKEGTYQGDNINNILVTPSWRKDTEMKPFCSEMAIRGMFMEKNGFEFQKPARMSKSICESIQLLSQGGGSLPNYSNQTQMMESQIIYTGNDVDNDVFHINDNFGESESQDWETVAEPSQPNFLYGRLSGSQQTYANELESEEEEVIAVVDHAHYNKPNNGEYLNHSLNFPHKYHAMQEIKTIHRDNLKEVNQIQESASLVAEPHDDIEYNVDYSWKGIADHAQAYNNRKDDDSPGHSNVCYNDLSHELEHKNVVIKNKIAPPPFINLQSSPTEGNARQTLLRTKNSRLVGDSSRLNEPNKRAVQELYSGDLLVHDCRSTQPSQIFIPPRYKSLKPKNLALDDQNSFKVQPSQTIMPENMNLPEKPAAPKNRRKRVSVPSQTRLMSFSLTSRDKLLPKSPTTHTSPSSNFVFHSQDSGTSSPRKFNSAPCLRRRNATAAANPKLHRRRKLKLSWLLFGACCLFPPALVCYGVGWMDSVMLSLSRGEVEHVGRIQRRVALVLGSFVCTVGVVIIITVVVMLRLKA